MSNVVNISVTCSFSVVFLAFFKSEKRGRGGFVRALLKMRLAKLKMQVAKRKMQVAK